MPEGTFCIASSRERIAIMPLEWEENRFLILERLCVRGCGWWALGDDEDGDDDDDDDDDCDESWVVMLSVIVDPQDHDVSVHLHKQTCIYSVFTSELMHI